MSTSRSRHRSAGATFWISDAWAEGAATLITVASLLMAIGIHRRTEMRRP